MYLHRRGYNRIHELRMAKKLLTPMVGDQIPGTQPGGLAGQRQREEKRPPRDAVLGGDAGGNWPASRDSGRLGRARAVQDGTGCAPREGPDGEMD